MSHILAIEMGVPPEGVCKSAGYARKYLSKILESCKWFVQRAAYLLNESDFTLLFDRDVEATQVGHKIANHQNLQLLEHVHNPNNPDFGHGVINVGVRARGRFKPQAVRLFVHVSAVQSPLLTNFRRKRTLLPLVSSATVYLKPQSLRARSLSSWWHAGVGPLQMIHSRSLHRRCTINVERATT